MARYSLRQATDNDLHQVLQWRNHPDVRSVMLTDHEISLVEHQAWWSKTRQAEDRQLLIFECDETAVGVINIYQWEKSDASAWWGFYLDNASLNQSQKTTIWINLEQAVIEYANKTLKLHQLFCETKRHNTLAWTLHKKMGFTQCQPPANATTTDQDVIYMVYTNEANALDSRPALYLLASHNTDFLTQALIKQSAHYPQLPYQIKSVDFGQYPILLHSPKGSEDALGLHHPDNALMFIERIEDFLEDSCDTITLENLAKAEDKFQAYIQLIAAAAKNNSNVFVADLQVHKPFPHSIEQRKCNSPLQQLISSWNQSIYDLQSQLNIHVLPYHNLINQMGCGFSDKYWYLARAPFTPIALEHYSNMIIGSVLATHSRTARVIVLDLDNTLWKGVIGDDGIEGIELGGDYPGNIYQALQELFLSLKQRGLLLCLCSKNTEAVALQCINQHPEMKLSQQDFVSWRINWQPKSGNIQSLAEELNIGLASFCFIDDNPVERAEVAANLPQVFVPNLPQDPSQWYQFISQLPELWQCHVTESDKARNELYQQRKALTVEAASFSNRTDFLSSLQMHLVIETLSKDNQARTLQLFNKTNQFNTTTLRYHQAQLIKLAEADTSMVLHIKLKDKYRAQFEGVAALVITHTNTQQWVIENFVMSCRVMGRDIEKVIIDELCKLAQTQQASSIIGHYIESPKNAPVKTLYKDNGFTIKDKDWVIALPQSSQQADLPEIKVDWHTRSIGEKTQ
ncbi:UDP-4-amino-4,6-dideoxy-N-acetyl-beta-L-altrosamine N-acetyltransferase [Shewanella maritima]|uniref:UDP-4-amino-4, 6-dideoxy-N-acetyl-beta-L-altrosamine N-acetyltransferase n=1 Tax=Shewanella maritima TaxID=2520507 RepID=UPI00373523B9